MKHQTRTTGVGARSWSASFGLVALGLLAALHIGGATFVDTRLSTTLDAGDGITDAGASYGSLVHMSDDGTILVVLSRLENSRAILTYTLEGDRTWTLTQTLPLATATGVEDMALSGDGEILVLAMRPSTVETDVEVWASPPEGRGAWTRATSSPILTLTGDESRDVAVATSFDGSVIAVGAPEYDDFVQDGVFEFFNAAGRIHTLRDDGSRTWAAQVSTASSGTGLRERERLGTAVAVSADGRTIVATAPGIGSVILPPPYGGISQQPFGGGFVFSLRSGGRYRQQDRLFASGNRGDDAGNCGGLNTCVAIDGGTIAIGAPFANYVDIFVGSFGTFGGYSLQATLRPSNSGSTRDGFGSAVALRNGFSLVGAPGSFSFRPPPGAAYLFRRQGATWNEPAVIDPPSELEAQIEYGRSVALTGPFVAIGSLTPGASSGDSVGKVTVFGTTGSFPPIPSPTFPPSEVPSAMPTETMPAATPTSAPIGIDDKCAVGISNEDVCCASECGICGGCDCALLGDATLGGAAFCCPATIRFNDIPCTASTDVGCVIPGVSPPPSRVRTGTECRD